MNILKLFFYVGIIVYITNCEDIDSRIGLLDSVLSNFHCHSIIFLSIGTNNGINYLKRFNTYDSGRNVYYGSSLTLSTFWKANTSGYKGGKRTVAVIEVNDRSVISLLERMTREVDISSFIWLVLTQTLITRDFENLTIPLSSEFIIAEENDLGFNLSELYNVDERKKLKKDAGVWHHESDEPGKRHVTSTTENFYRRRKNLEGGTIKVISPREDPCPGVSFHVGIFAIVQCIHFRIWNTMAEMLNATTEVIINPGLNLDSIANTEADLTLRSASMNSFDMSSRSYMWPIFRERIQIYTKLIGQDVGWKTFINPFDYYMWAIILIWMVFCELILLTVEFITVTDWDRENPFLNYYRKYSFLSFFAFCNQADSDAPNLLGYRLVHFLVFLVPAFLIPGYEAVLTSFLTVELPRMPFRNLDELSRSHDYRFGWHRAFSMGNHFSKNDSTPTIHRLFHGIALPEDELPATDTEAMERLCSKKFAYVSTRHTVLALKPRCQFDQFDEYLVVVFTTMEMKKESMYLSFVNRCVRLLRFTGILLKIRLKVVLQFLSYDKEMEPPDQFSPIVLGNIVLPFVALFAGMIFSVVILSLEKIRFRCKTNLDFAGDAID